MCNTHCVYSIYFVIGFIFGLHRRESNKPLKTWVSVQSLQPHYKYLTLHTYYTRSTFFLNGYSCSVLIKNGFSFFIAAKCSPNILNWRIFQKNYLKNYVYFNKFIALPTMHRNLHYSFIFYFGLMNLSFYFFFFID